MPIIEFKNFSFRFANLREPTLNNLNFQIKEGEKVLIAGASGSGKSTLMHCINGIVPFAHSGELKGELVVSGIKPYNQNIFEISKKAGTILQDQDSQFIGLTVGEDVAFIQENNNINPEIMKKKVYESLQSVQMQKFIDQSPYELSGGQKQSVSLAGILSSGTDILLFDEPLANLDPASGKKVIELIDELHKKYRKTIIIIEHRIEDVLERNIDRLIVIDKGRIKANEKPDTVLKQDILRKYGLREPLYIEALKHFSIDLKIINNIHDINSCKNPEVKKTLSTKKIIYKKNNNYKKRQLLLSVQNINFSYDRKGRQILKNVSFELDKGEIISILGNNGAGKSTLSNIITGILKPDSGTINLSGKDITAAGIKEIGQKIGYVMQNPNHMIVKNMIKDEVCLGLNAYRYDKNFIEERYLKTVKTCGLYGYRNWPVSSLSYGQKKRVTIASILALDPKVVVLDEPTAGQDYRTYTEIMDFISRLTEKGIGIILITHDMHLALEYTTRSIVLSNGKIIGNDKPSKILSNEKIVAKANLKETSLSRLSGILELEDKEEFIQNFIETEKGVRAVE